MREAPGGRPEPAKVVDVRGEYCPRPIIETARAIKLVEVGQVVLVVGTDKGIHSDMPAWCKATGHELLALHEENDVIEARVRRMR